VRLIRIPSLRSMSRLLVYRQLIATAAVKNVLKRAFGGSIILLSVNHP
jgi:hypothetical protein